jgi:IS4 transposase
LIEQAKVLCSDDNYLDVKLKGRIYALDATVVDLCLDVFWWAKFRTTKAALKINTLLDLKTSIPEFILITEGSVHEVKVLDSIFIESGSYLVMDKAYVDFARLWKLTKDNITFVIRAKENMQYKVTYRKSVDKTSGLICDQDIVLTGINTSQKYPEALRRIKYFDEESGNTFVFLTNNFKLSALTVSTLYRYRWGIETFFKWIKQHLKILSFWGHSENAVKTQVWIAISTYVLAIIAKKKLKLPQTLYEILQMVSLSVFDRTPLNQLFTEDKYQDFKEPLYNQLKLF